MRRIPRRVLAGIAGLAVIPLSVPMSAPGHAEEPPAFHRLSTFPVYLNTSIDDVTAAEISAVTADGNTVVYTNSPLNALGFVDITDPAAPQPAGHLDLAGEPTSVTVVGDRILAAINTSANFVEPSGELAVLDAGSREMVTTVQLGGQPDSIAVDGDHRYAAVAIENERDEDVNDGDLPQAPGGWLSIVDLTDYEVTEVDLTGLAAVAPQDAEPEYVAVNDNGQAVVTLQENNHIVIVDLATASVTGHFSAGSAQVTGVDTLDDDLIDPSGSIDAPREPDSVAWIGDDLIATANEGDWRGGTRGWTVFNTQGDVVYDAGNDFENLAIAHGQYPDKRSDAKGAEPEGLTTGVFNGVPYLFVASERGNFVAVYDITDPAAPRFTQLLPTTNEPEGLTTVPQRDLLIVSSELDEPDNGLRSTVQVYRLGSGVANFPSLVSDPAAATPIGWGALSGLSAVPGAADRLYAVTDSAFAHTRLLTIDVGARPAEIVDAVTVTKDGVPAGYDAEGVHARTEGGFWLAGEGDPDDDLPNLLVRLDADAKVVSEIPLPAEVADSVTGNGLEGVTAFGSGSQEVVWVALQAPLSDENHARLGRYDVSAGTWSWVGYSLEAPQNDGWVGLSEITAVDSDTVAVIERDNQLGPAAAIKRIYTVDLSGVEPVSTGVPPVAPKTAVHDVLPELAEGAGWVPDKLEGLAVAGNGRVYVVTDNDLVDDATGETMFLDLGRATDVFGPVAEDPDGSLPVTGVGLALPVAVAVGTLVLGAVALLLLRHRVARTWA